MTSVQVFSLLVAVAVAGPLYSLYTPGYPHTGISLGLAGVAHVPVNAAQPAVHVVKRWSLTF